MVVVVVSVICGLVVGAADDEEDEEEGVFSVVDGEGEGTFPEEATAAVYGGGGRFSFSISIADRFVLWLLGDVCACALGGREAEEYLEDPSALA